MEKKGLKQFAIKLDGASPIPIYEQIKQGIKLAVLSGELQEGDQVPPIREFASTLKVNPNTIVKVYYQLEVEGYLKARMGMGIFVHRDPQKTAPDSQGLFLQLTDEFVARASKLGISLRQMAEELSRRSEGQSGKKGKKESDR